MILWRNALEKYLREFLGENLELTWTQNRRVMISFQHRKGVPLLRLHESFAVADEKVKGDLAKYLTKSRAKVPVSVREFINTASSERPSADRAQEKLTHRGRNYDLRKIYRKLNKGYFEGLLKGRITWGRKVFNRKKRSILFGSYLPAHNIIRIHPILDTELVPLFFLEFVVYHEMSHEFLDTLEGGNDNGRHHTPRFRELEKEFKYYELASSWEKRHFEKLLRYRPKS